MKLIITDMPQFPMAVKGEHKIIQPREEIHPCVGCFGCWVKTPGRCILPDSYREVGIEMGRCDALILVSRCCYGSVSPFVKMVQDRGLSYIHPDFVLRQGEMHHKRRYDNVLALSIHLYGADITPAEKETARKLLAANAKDYDGLAKGVYFYETAEALEGVVL